MQRLFFYLVFFTSLISKVFAGSAIPKTAESKPVVVVLKDGTNVSFYTDGLQNELKQPPRLTTNSDALLVPAKLGAPVETTNNSILMSGSCLKLPPFTIDNSLINPNASISFEQLQSSGDLAKLLGVGAGVSYSIGPFTLSAEGNFAREQKGFGTQMDYLFLSEYGATASLPTNYFPVFAEQYKKYSTDNLREVCGNSFIAQTKVGVFLLVKVTIKFETIEQKEEFAASVKLSNFVGSLEAKIKHAVNSKSTNSKLEIRAIQKGGEPEKLAKIFGTTSGDMPILECGGDNNSNNKASQNEPCYRMLGKIVNYAESIWTTQVLNSNKQLNLDKLVYFASSSISNYPQQNIVLNKELAHKLTAFSDEYTKDSNLLTYLENYDKLFHAQMSFSALEQLEKSMLILKDRINNIYLNSDIVYFCYTIFPNEHCNNLLADKSIELKNSYAFTNNELDIIKVVTQNVFDISNMYGYSKCKLIPISKTKMIASCLNNIKNNLHSPQFGYKLVNNSSETSLYLYDFTYQHLQNTIQYQNGESNEIKLNYEGFSTYHAAPQVKLFIDGHVQSNPRIPKLMVTRRLET